MVKTITAAEARRRFAEITDEVYFGDVEYIVLKNGKKVANISSVKTFKAEHPTFIDDLADFELRYEEALTDLASK